MLTQCDLWIADSKYFIDWAQKTDTVHVLGEGYWVCQVQFICR